MLLVEAVRRKHIPGTLGDEPERATGDEVPGPAVEEKGQW